MAKEEDVKNPKMAKQNLRLKTAEANLKEEEVDFKKKECDLKELEVIQKSIYIDDLRVSDKLSKIRTLSGILMYCNVDKGTTIGSETRWKNVFDESEEQVIKNKILSLVEKL